ncbi:MAG: hypothetical protein PHR94_13370 [Methylomonas lenta]|nr:hypothetical protein [Methylomonas lenta]
MNTVIQSNPGFSVLTLCINKAGRLSYQRENVIAWYISGTNETKEDRQNLSAFPILPLNEGVFYDFDAIEHPLGSIQTEHQTFKDLAEWLSHEETERAKHGD